MRRVPRFPVFLSVALVSLALAGCKVRFGNEWALWLGALVPAVIAGYVVSFVRKRRALRRFLPGRDETSLGEGSLARRAVRAAVLVVALGLAIVALSRPQYGGKEKMLKVKGLDIALVLDFSKSMYAQDVKPDRITMLKQEVTAFLGGLTGDRVGVVAFAGEAVRFPLTADYEAIRLFLKDMGPADMPLGGTNIALAVQGATEILVAGFTKQKRSKVMILVTDGEDHGGGVEEVARAAQAKGIRIYTLGIGTGTPELIPSYLPDGTQDGFMRDSAGTYVTTSLAPQAEDMLERIAGSTGGTYMRSSPGKVSLASVESEIRKLKQSELKTRKVTIYDEFYLWFLVPALVLLFLETVPGDARSRLGRLWAERQSGKERKEQEG